MLKTTFKILFSHNIQEMLSRHDHVSIVLNKISHFLFILKISLYLKNASFKSIFFLQKIVEENEPEVEFKYI